MKIVSLILLLTLESFASAQLNNDYRPMARGGHYIQNGRYQQNPQRINPNYYQQQPQQQFQQQQPQSSYNVIGNTAENIYGRSAINSIVGSRFSDDSSAVNSIINPISGSSNNVIGNKASNIFGGGGFSPYGNL
jgi:hypothetical protein